MPGRGAIVLRDAAVSLPFACRDYCKRNGIAVGATFVNHGIASSAPLSERAGFAGLLACLRWQNVSVVIVDDATHVAGNFPHALSGSRGGQVDHWQPTSLAAELKQLLPSESDLRALPPLCRG